MIQSQFIVPLYVASDRNRPAVAVATVRAENADKACALSVDAYAARNPGAPAVRAESDLVFTAMTRVNWRDDAPIVFSIR